MATALQEFLITLKEKLENKGIKVACFDVIEDDLGDIAMNMVDAATVVLGGSMVLASPHPAIANIAYIANLLKPKAKFASFIGSYGWGGNLFGKLGEILSGLKVQLIEPVLVKGKPKEADYKLLDEMVDTIYNFHKDAGLV